MEETKLTEVNEEIEGTEEIEEIPESSGIGTGWAMLIGSGLTLAAIAAGKKAKKLWQACKARKEPSAEETVIIDVEPKPVEEPAQPEPEPQVEKPEKKTKK